MIVGLMYYVSINELVFSVFSIFFFKQKTAYEMRISDWSSDVCSSDLDGLPKRNVGDRQGARLAFPASADMRDRMTPALPSATDVLIVGPGIAGAGLAAMLSPHRPVTILAADVAPGRHTTRHSAAFLPENPGGAQLRPLSLAPVDPP